VKKEQTRISSQWPTDEGFGWRGAGIPIPNGLILKGLEDRKLAGELPLVLRALVEER